MPKRISRSNRIYYDELGEDASTTIHHDICIYNTMVRVAYCFLYHNSEGNMHQLLKQRFNINDYLPLSAVSQAKGILASNRELQKQYVQEYKSKIRNVEKR